MPRWWMSLSVALLSCGGAKASHVTMTPSVPPRDRPVALAAGQYGPTFVRFADDTVGTLRTTANAKSDVLWRSSWRVKDLVADTGKLCVLTVDDDAFCVSGETGNIAGQRLHEPGALDVALTSTTSCAWWRAMVAFGASRETTS